MSSTPQYDYIISGAGCAGLSLAMHLIHSGKFSDKKILLIDQDPKQSNDRTWCFWEKEPKLFEPVVYRRWEKLWYHGKDFSREFMTSPYVYKMIRGIDFYNFCLDTIRQQENFTIVCKKVDHIFSSEQTTGLMVDGKPIHCSFIFNSILFDKPILTPKQFWLLQHFKGWVIETEVNVFDPGGATLMDFRIDQQWGTAFCYVLPFSSQRALVEYTLFSKTILPADQYDQGLKAYIEDILKINSYRIAEQEFGVIPMTNFKFATHQNNLVNIGTAGGQTKGSSGFTFNFIQKHSEAIVKQLDQTGKPFVPGPVSRFSFYDGVLLNILYNQRMPGSEIFTDLFKKNNPERVLRFLDNETTLREEVGIISALPTLPFLKAAMSQLT